VGSHHAERFTPVAPEVAALWMGYGHWDAVHFPSVIGLSVEEVRTDYCRMRLPWRTEITQPAGVAHGGAIATLVDSVVVPAIGAGYSEPMRLATISLNVSFLGALIDEAAIGEGWVIQRGRTIVFCQAEVRGATSDRLVATASLAYRVAPNP
jgi:uncharacterized protein (TIGR00369 family)